MNSQSDNPFATIESAHEFVNLLTKAVSDAKEELEVSVGGESGSDESRRVGALRLALYSLAKLDNHLRQSSRILNDLRTLRRLMLAEREIKDKTISSNLPRGVDEATSAEEIETQSALGRLPL